MGKTIQVIFLMTLLVFLSGSGAGAAETAIELDRVEISGVTVFQGPEIEGVLEINPGDKLERIKVVRTAENLQASYRIRGYEQVSIQSRLFHRKGEGGVIENVLEFSVKEGKPTRIASVDFVADEIPDERFRKTWERLSSDLGTRLGVIPGDRFDQEKIANGKRSVQDALASEEFIGARADDVRVLPAEMPPGLSPEKRDAARWVKLEIHVDLGDRVTFGFRGNGFLTSQRLSTLIEDQRSVGLGKNYVAAIQGMIEEQYRSVGFAQVKATPFTFESQNRRERHVTYIIEEGPRVAIDSVDFDGNLVFTSDQLRDQFYRRASGLVQSGFYYEKDIQKASDLLVEWIKSQGYLAAKLVTINSVFPPKPRTRAQNSSVRITIYLYEGEQTLVQSVTFKGLKAFTPDEVKNVLGAHEGEPLNLFAFTDGIETLKAMYLNRGFLGFRIVNENTDTVIKYTQENHYAEVYVEVDEGPMFRVSRIQIDGLVETKESVVRRELLFREGEVLTEAMITESEGNLRRLGIFSAISIRPFDDPEKHESKIVRILLQEGTPGYYGVGFGFRNDLGVRLFGRTGYSNLWDRNHTVFFNLQTNHRFENFHFQEYQGQLGYIWPWFGVNDLTFRPTFTVSGTQYILFDSETRSISPTLEKVVLKKPNLTAVFSYSLESIRQFNAPLAQVVDVNTGQVSFEDIDNGDLRIGAIIPSLKLDMRDHPLAPTRGLFATASYEIATPWLLSQRDPYPIGYTRFIFRADYIFPIGSEISWFLSFRTGYERQAEPVVLNPDGTENRRSGAIPASKTFTMGGPGSLRGFKEQELNLQETLVRGTATYVNYRTQIDLPFAGALKFGPFLDAANLLVDDYSLGRLRYGTGIGFHYQTPIGPVNADWGFKVNPQPGESPMEFSFTIGII